jgi:anti-anti-sigma factor
VIIERAAATCCQEDGAPPVEDLDIGKVTPLGAGSGIAVLPSGIVNHDRASQEYHHPGMEHVPSPYTPEVLSVRGFIELTAHNSERFRSQISAALNGHTSIEIDLSRTTFMDCSGLSALIALRNHAHGRSGVMRLVNPTRAVRRLFEIARVEQVFEIVDTVGLHPMAPVQPWE